MGGRSAGDRILPRDQDAARAVTGGARPADEVAHVVLPEYVEVVGDLLRTTDSRGTLWTVLDEHGKLVDGAEDPELGRDLCTEIYTGMLRLNVRGGERRGKC